MFAIGDSVMLGAKGALQQKIPGIIVDAVVSRQFAHAISVLQFYKDNGLLPPIVVVHLGTNGRFGDGEFDTMMATIGDDRQAYFLTRASRGCGRRRSTPRRAWRATASERAPDRLAPVFGLPQ